ncbi:tetratricopeptide repeat protein [Phenylobacterium sp.]|uniref:tetratricopeptide repeat protein n=1 Tax=Phenylobacterium sp. TaxID=1871053 RepID=UPI0035C7D461
MSRPPAAPVLHALKARASRLERQGDLPGALEAYRQALAAAPGDPEILASLAGVAERLDMAEAAEALWRQARASAPASAEAVDGHARALGVLGRFDEAVSLLQSVLSADPADARLWNTLGVTLTRQGRADEALPFFDEALRLDPRSATAAYNRASAHFDLEAYEAAETDFTAARKLARRPADAAMIDFAAATLALARGDLAAGWAGYESRLSPHAPRPVSFEAPGRRWTPNLPLEGRRLLVFAEQGLGDEILFASLVPDLLAALGPDGRLSLAMEPRLVRLLARSFPEAEVVAHHTETRDGRLRRSAPDLAAPRAVELWTTLGSLPQRFRRRIADFPAAPPPLRPDPARVAHWRAWLGDGPPAVGLSWRSGKLGGDRRRHYPPLDAWRPVLRERGIRLVNLQYGAEVEEVDALSAIAGRALMQPPGLDLKADIDDLAALCAALPGIVAVNNATAQLAGACDAPTVMLCGAGAWLTLGQDRYPWRPSVRPVAPKRFGDWSQAMDDALAKLRELLAADRRRPAS